MRELIAELETRRAQAAEGGLPRARERHLARGKLLPRERVMTLVTGKLPATLELVLVAMLFAIALGLALGLAAVYFRGRWPGLLKGCVDVFLQGTRWRASLRNA